MNEQKRILDLFMKQFNRPTLRDTSDLTGIQLTRVFRLFNGSEMKLEEYLIFMNLIKEDTGKHSPLSRLAYECSQSLNVSVIKELENHLEQKLKLWNYLQTSKNINSEKMA